MAVEQELDRPQRAISLSHQDVRAASDDLLDLGKKHGRIIGISVRLLKARVRVRRSAFLCAAALDDC